MRRQAKRRGVAATVGKGRGGGKHVEGERKKNWYKS